MIVIEIWIEGRTAHYIREFVDILDSNWSIFKKLDEYPLQKCTVMFRNLNIMIVIKFDGGKEMFATDMEKRIRPRQVP